MSVEQEARELLAAAWGDHRQWADIVQRIRDGSCAVHSDVVSLSCALAIEAITAALLRSSASRDEVLEEAIAIAAKHAQRARDAVAECRDWSPAQAEWSRARDLGEDIVDDLRNLKHPEGERGGS